jgi:hypothetical protein
MSIFTTKDDVNSFQSGQFCVDASCLKRINKVNSLNIMSQTNTHLYNKTLI